MSKYIAFTLTMPNRGSWNGGWSGEGKVYVIVRKFSGKKGEAKAAEILTKPDYYHRWDDGWGANVAVKAVDGRTSAALKRKSAGFCGYEWMVDSICNKGHITTD